VGIFLYNEIYEGYVIVLLEYWESIYRKGEEAS